MSISKEARKLLTGKPLITINQNQTSENSTFKNKIGSNISTNNTNINQNNVNPNDYLTKPSKWAANVGTIGNLGLGTIQAGLGIANYFQSLKQLKETKRINDANLANAKRMADNEVRSANLELRAAGTQAAQMSGSTLEQAQKKAAEYVKNNGYV